MKTLDNFALIEASLSSHLIVLFSENKACLKSINLFNHAPSAVPGAGFSQ